MKNKFIIRLLDSIESEKTNHNSGTKKVLIKENESASNLTQAAVSKLKKGAIVEAHTHNTMEELFYVLDGDVSVTIKQNKFNCKKNTIIKIPPKTSHSMEALSDVTFFYWGIATS